MGTETIKIQDLKTSISKSLVTLGIPPTPARVQVIYENNTAIKKVFYRLKLPGHTIRFMDSNDCLHIAY